VAIERHGDAALHQWCDGDLVQAIHEFADLADQG